MKITPPIRKLTEVGITQTELAYLTGWDTREISRVLLGQRRTPAIQKSIAKVVNIPRNASIDKQVKWLFGKWAWMELKKRNGRRKASHRKRTV